MKQAKQYFSKMLMLLPLTFLMTPLFYTLLGFHPEIKFFNLFVYLWYAAFIYIGMTLSFIFKKYPYLPYPIAVAIAFLCKNILELPIVGIKQNIFYTTNPAANISNSGIITGAEMTVNEFAYLSGVVFVTSLIAGIVGVYYSKKTALEFVDKGNTLVFVYFALISGFYIYISGILDIDKSASTMYMLYYICLAVSYFLVRNFAHLNRQLEIYAENGAYNVSGTKRIYAYYFISLIILTPLPFVICFFVVPYIVPVIFKILEFLLALIVYIITLLRPSEPDAQKPKLPAGLSGLPDQNPRSLFYETMIVYLLIAVALIIIFVFRKYIMDLIKAIIDFFKTKINVSGYNKAIINQEIITDVKKDKKLKSSYKDYLKQVRKIKDLRKKFLFAYNYIFWTVIKKDEVLKESATPNEVAEKYQETQSFADLYQDLKYGDKPKESIEIETETEKAEVFLKSILNTKG